MSIAVRMLLSAVIGGIIGMERERKNRPAGFRTYMLVCTGAALVMMTNQYVATVFNAGDIARMGAQVVSGIGFLGAGTIMVTGKNKIKGITTAAGLWTAACLGLAIGIGFYEGAIVGGVFIIVIITVMQRLEAPMRRRTRYVEIYIEFEEAKAFSKFIEFARQHEMEIYDIQIQRSSEAGAETMAVILMARSKEKLTNSEIVHLLGGAQGVKFIEELQ